jgi:hypothetical protein
MEIGEEISAPEFFDDEVHNTDTCPWHTASDGSAAKMDATDPDEDTDAMPPNDGGKLGRNLKADGEDPPGADEVTITYQKGALIKYTGGKKPKTVQTYAETDDEEPYALQYAPHHLIPGNESLKGSALVAFLGDDDVIGEFAGGQASVIKKGLSAGYDVNRAANGAWLPSPYALSNKNGWPAAPGIQVIKKRGDARVAEQTEDFKTAYVAAAIEAAGDRQFHMRHNEYSEKVGEILAAMHVRLAKMATGLCPLAESSEADDKYAPPPGLKARLDVLSGNLRGFVQGPVWRAPLYTDALTENYAMDERQTAATGDIVKVL